VRYELKLTIGEAKAMYAALSNHLIAASDEEGRQFFGNPEQLAAAWNVHRMVRRIVHGKGVKAK
jgi:hypothetical protein